MDQPYGEVPPFACSPCEYTVPTTPEGTVVVVSTSGAAVIVTDIATELVSSGSLWSVTVAVKGYVPLAVGVPEINPLAPASVSPGGRLPPVTDQAYGVVPPLASSVCEYAVPLVPPASLADVIVKAIGAIVTEADTDFVNIGLLLSLTVSLKL
jgi:hypothetical protein